MKSLQINKKEGKEANPKSRLKNKMKKIIEGMKYSVLAAGIILGAANCGGEGVTKAGNPPVYTDGDYDKEQGESKEMEAYEKEISEREGTEREAPEYERTEREERHEEDALEREQAEEKEIDYTVEQELENTEEEQNDEVCETVENTLEFLIVSQIDEDDTHQLTIVEESCEGEEIPERIDARIMPPLELEGMGKKRYSNIKFVRKDWEIAGVYNEEEEGKPVMRLIKPDRVETVYEKNACELADALCGGCTTEEPSGNEDACMYDPCESPPRCDIRGECDYYILDPEIPRIRIELWSIDPGPKTMVSIRAFYEDDEGLPYGGERERLNVEVGKGGEVTIETPDGEVKRYVQTYDGNGILMCLSNRKGTVSTSKEYILIEDESIVFIEEFNNTPYRIRLKINEENNAFSGWVLEKINVE